MSTVRDITYFTLLLTLFMFIMALLGREIYAESVKIASLEN